MEGLADLEASEEDSDRPPPVLLQLPLQTLPAILIPEEEVSEVLVVLEALEKLVLPPPPHQELPQQVPQGAHQQAPQEALQDLQEEVLEDSEEVPQAASEAHLQDQPKSVLHQFPTVV